MINQKLPVMIKNIGTTDRIIRLIVAALIVLLYFTGQLSGTIGIVLLVVAVVMALTALVRFCPAYLPFKINTLITRKK